MRVLLNQMRGEKHLGYVVKSSSRVLHNSTALALTLTAPFPRGPQS